MKLAVGIKSRVLFEAISDCFSRAAGICACRNLDEKPDAEA